MEISLHVRDARVDIVAENFWCRNRQKSYLDVKVEGNIDPMLSSFRTGQETCPMKPEFVK